MPVVSVLCVIPFPLCGVSCDNTMAAKTYEVQFLIDGRSGAVNQRSKENEEPGALAFTDDELRKEVLGKFKRILEQKYPDGTLSPDFRTFTTNKEVETTQFGPKEGPLFKAITGVMTNNRAIELNKKLRLVVPDGSLKGSIQLSLPPAPAPAPKEAPKAPKAAPPVDPSKPKKTYNVTFLVPNVGTFQYRGNVLFSDDRDEEVLTKFENALKAKFKGDLSEDKKTFMTSEDVKLNPAGYYKLPVKNLLEPEEDEEGEKGNSGYDSDEEETNVGEINLIPVKTGGKRRKTRRSTRRKRMTRRR